MSGRSWSGGAGQDEWGGDGVAGRGSGRSWREGRGRMNEWEELECRGEAGRVSGRSWSGGAGQDEWGGDVVAGRGSGRSWWEELEGGSGQDE